MLVSIFSYFLSSSRAMLWLNLLKIGVIWLCIMMFQPKIGNYRRSLPCMLVVMRVLLSAMYYILTVHTSDANDFKTP